MGVEEGSLLEAWGPQRGISKRHMIFELRPDGYVGGRRARVRFRLMKAHQGYIFMLETFLCPHAQKYCLSERTTEWRIDWRRAELEEQG